MSAEPFHYFDRYERSIKVEPIYGERWLRAAYCNPAGRFLVWLLIRRKIFSWWYGGKMRGRWSGLKILPFISRYNLNVDEFEKSPFDFRTFNDFFCRALKPEARPIAQGERVAALPADGRHLAFPDVGAADGFYVKGVKFTLAELFGEEGKAEEERPFARRYEGGAMLISRLCPTDYHRFHFSAGGMPGESRLLNGLLYSVHPLALRRNIRYLVQNKREITEIETEAFGSVAMVEIGATNVGKICQTFIPGRAVAKGEEKGFFAFGGSCVVTLFRRGAIRFDSDLVEQSARGMETFARMGDRLGEAT